MRSKLEQIASYRAALLQGIVPVEPPPYLEEKGLIWSDFMIITTLDFFFHAEEKSAWLASHQRWIETHPMFLHLNLTTCGILKIHPHDSAVRSLLWGTLIAANMAIRMQTSEACFFKENILRLSSHAYDLKRLYHTHWRPLEEMQSQCFLSQYEAMQTLFHLILNSKMPTSILIFQANQDACDVMYTPLSAFNLALVDLGHYLLYRESLNVFKHHATDTLQFRRHDTPIDRHWIAKRLGVNVLTIEIDTFTQTHSTFDQVTPRDLPSITLVVIKGLTQLLIDRMMLTHLEKERPERHIGWHLLLHTTRQQTLEFMMDRLIQSSIETSRASFLKAWDQWIEHQDARNLTAHFEILCDQFHREIRDPIWHLQSQDVLYELASLIDCWMMALEDLQHQSDKVALLSDYLMKIYRGEVPVVSILPQPCHLILYIGGRSHPHHVLWRLDIQEVSPFALQAISVLITSLNQCLLDIASDVFHQHLKKWMLCLSYLIKQADMSGAQKHQLSMHMRSFFETMLKTLDARQDRARLMLTDLDLNQRYIFLCQSLNRLALPEFLHHPLPHWQSFRAILSPIPNTNRPSITFDRQPIFASSSPTIRPPMPSSLRIQLDSLKRDYRQHRTVLTTVKDAFWVELDAELTASPEDTYTTCIHRVIAGREAYQRAIGKNGFFGGGFAGRHRSFELVQALKALDEPSDIPASTI